MHHYFGSYSVIQFIFLLDMLLCLTANCQDLAMYLIAPPQKIPQQSWTLLCQSLWYIIMAIYFFFYFSCPSYLIPFCSLLLSVDLLRPDVILQYSNTDIDAVQREKGVCCSLFFEFQILFITVDRQTLHGIILYYKWNFLPRGLTLLARAVSHYEGST